MRVYLLALLFAFTACGHKKPKVEPSAKPAEYKSAAEIPVEEFFRNPALFGYRISPDGKNLALLKSWKNRLNVFVHPVSDPKALKQVTFVEDRDLSEIIWKGSDHILYSKDIGGDENDHIFAVNIKTGDTKDLTPHPGIKAQLVDDLIETSPTDVLIEHNQRNKELFDVYRVNVETGASQLVAENKNQISMWLIDHEGKVRGGSATDGVNTVLYYEKAKGKPWVSIFKTNFRNSLVPIGFTADNKRLFAVTNLNSDLERLVEINPNLPSSKFITKTIYKHPKYDLSEADYSEVRRGIGRVQVITDRREIFFLHPEDQKDWNELKSKIKDASIILANDSRDERFWVIKTHTDVTRGSYFLYDRMEKKLTDLGNVSPWLNPNLMSEMKTVHYKSRDGLNIEGYLTLPRGKDPKNLPIVVNVHGGPWARDEWGFDPESQFLASRGYGVFQINYRGSTGYGRKFWEASFKQWGKKMQDDITDGVKWLISQGTADPKKVCIYGGSYGGYATLAGITFTPDLYACAIDYVGVSNLFTFMTTIPPYWKPYLEMMYAMVGHPEKDKDLMRAASPVFHVDKIKTPLFVAQGANDPRVNKAESDQIVEALKKRGVAVEYMVKANEGHGFANEENRFDFYRAMEKFLAKHLGGRQ